MCASLPLIGDPVVENSDGICGCEGPNFYDNIHKERKILEP